MFPWNDTALFSIFIGLSLKSTAVLGVAWLITLMSRRRSAAARHLVWTAASAALLALPILSLTLPALRVPAAGTLLPLDLIFRTNAVQAPSVAGQTNTPATTPGPSSPGSTRWRLEWRPLLMFAWATGAAVVLLQMLIAWVTIWRVRRAARPFSGTESDSLAGTLGIRQAIDVLEARPGSMPMTFGLFRPAVFLPADASGWSVERRRMVLLHEMAHVRRGDVALHIMARTALSLHWWNPLAWIAWREFLKERERAADDMVLSAGARASEYASHLLEVARTMQWTPAFEGAAIAIARGSELESRLQAILDSRISRKATARIWVLAAALLAVGLIAPIAALQAQESQATPRFRTQSVPADIDAVISAAISQKNHEILDQAAKAAEQLRMYDQAHRLLETAVTIRGDVSGQQSVDYGVGLLKLGELESTRGMKKEAEDFYTKAAHVLGDKPEAAGALIYLGKAAVQRKDYTQAFDYLQHAQRIDPAKSGTALMWMAVVRQHEQKPDDAEFLFQSAMSAHKPDTQDAVVSGRIYAQFLRSQGRAGEATELDARMSTMQKAVTAQAGPRPASSAGVYRIGGDVKAPALLSKIEPQYSEDARAAKLAGTVIIYVEIGPDGVARNARITQGLGLGLDEKAIEAIDQWKFRPGMKDGQPVTVAATIEVNFKLL